MLQAQDFSEVFNIDQGKFDPQKEEVDVNQVVEQISSLEMSQNDKEIEMNDTEVQYSAPAKIVTHMQTLLHVLRNLVLTLS